MTREKALQAMDKLVAMGYTVTLSERDLGAHGHVMISNDGEMTSISRWLEVHEISLDKIDLRSLVSVADDLDLDVGFSTIQGGVLSFTDQPSEIEQRKREVTSGRRRHPR